jgi:hypothetical protein
MASTFSIGFFLGLPLLALTYCSIGWLIFNSSSPSELGIESYVLSLIFLGLPLGLLFSIININNNKLVLGKDIKGHQIRSQCCKLI